MGFPPLFMEVSMVLWNAYIVLADNGKAGVKFIKI